MSFINSNLVPTSIRSSSVTQGTNAGVVASLSGVTGKITQVAGIIGYTDTASLISFAKQLTGTLSISSSTDDIVGVGTLFTSELNVGDVLLLFDGTNIEYLTILTITDDTNIVTTANATNSFSGVGVYSALAITKTLANVMINADLTAQNLVSNTSKGIAIAIHTSTSACTLTITGFNR